jgi:ferredoxin
MPNVFKDLALRLDAIPNGFPATESGVELRLLAKLFAEDEAGLAAGMETEALTAAELAGRSGRDEATVRPLLKSMLSKGLIELEKTERGIGFKLIPFVVGFYERQNGRIDAEFAALFEAYAKEGFHKIMAVKPAVHRVIPVEKAIPAGVEVMPYERASGYVEAAKAWAVLPCICRVQKRLAGKACGHSEENCLVMSGKAGAFDRAPGFRALSKEEALGVLAAADAEGLVHSTGNFKAGVDYICNCCVCSCGVLRAYAEQGYRSAVAKSDFYAEAAASSCSGCGLCVDRCPFGAVAMDGSIAAVDQARCYGCGLCATACPTGAMAVRLRPEAERETLPEDGAAWTAARAAARKAADRLPS